MHLQDQIISLLHQRDARQQTEDQLLHQMGMLLNNLIVHDFHSLVQLLYRVDVPEKEVKKLLQDQPGTDAGLLLASLLLQRQQEKDLLRQKFEQNKDDIPDNERW